MDEIEAVGVDEIEAVDAGDVRDVTLRFLVANAF